MSKSTKHTYEKLVKKLYQEIVILEKKPENNVVYQKLIKKMKKYTELWKINQ